MEIDTVLQILVVITGIWLLVLTIRKTIYTTESSLHTEVYWELPLENDQFILTFVASNSGGRSVTITKCGMELPNNKIVIFNDFLNDKYPFPITLDMGDYCEKKILLKQVVAPLFEEGYWYQDSAMINFIFWDSNNKKHSVKWHLYFRKRSTGS